MQDIVVTPKPFGVLQIRMIGHYHHKAFRMRMGRIDLSTNTSIKNFCDVVNVLKPMTGSRQGVSIKQTRQGILQTSPPRIK